DTEKTINVVVNGDRTAESDEAFSVDLTGATGAILSAGHAVGTIVDDEPWVSIDSGPTVTEGNLGTTTANFTVRLSATYDAEVDVDYTTLDGSALAGSDYQAAKGTLVIPKGQTVATIPVLVYGDKVAEFTESFSVQVTGSPVAHIGNGWASAS